MRLVRPGSVVVLAVLFAACADTRKPEPPLQATEDCERCHGYPPLPNGPFIAATTTSHPAGATDCSSCHGDTVESDDVTIKPGGLHMNGVVDALGHAAGYDDPAAHGPDALAFLAGGGTSTCSDCHGATLTGGTGPSCASCHDGVVDDWKTNCTFCHGTTTHDWTGTSLTLAAPPEAVDGTADQARTNPRVGAHQAHLQQGTFAAAQPCASCHLVPAPAGALTHFEASGAHASMAFSTLAGKGTVAGYAGAGGNCTVYCHGSGTEFANPANQASPAWTTTGIACGDCHGTPPQSGGTFPSPNPHAFHATVGVECSTCHPGYSIGGTPPVNLTTHVNGLKEVVGDDRWNCTTCHNLLGVPLMHPPLGDQHLAAALADIASCTQCHGATYGGGSGPSCNACHATQVTASAPDWKTNCTFCHGTRTADVTSATALAAPPQSVAATGAQDGTNPRIGAHQRHLAGGTYSNAFACDSCHTVPGGAQSLTHFTGGAATIAFSTFASQGVASPGYAGSGGACAVYCHGSGTSFANPPGTVSPAWTSTAMACNACHGQPPTSGPAIAGTDAHAFHVGASVACGSCHSGYTPVNKALHVNGAKDAIGNAGWNCTTCHAAVSKPRTHAAGYVGTHTVDALAGIAACAGCHGSDYSVEFLGAGSSCNGCHGQITTSLPDWKTNCTFCHGTRAQNVTSATPAAAPPQAVVGVGDQTRTNPRVGAHQVHLTVGPFSNALPCSTCHAVPTGAQSLTHFAYTGGQAAVAFDALARQGAATAAYSGAGGNCTVYCHGSGTSWPTGSVAANRLIAWTATGLTCTSCHAIPPNTGPSVGAVPAHAFHVTSRAVPCSTCHNGYSNTTVDKASHPDGVRDVIIVRVVGGGLLRITGWDCVTCHDGLGI